MTDERDRPDAPPPGDRDSWLVRSAKNRAARRTESMRSYGSLSTAGMSFTFSILIATGLGLWLDRLTGWSPWCFIVFFLLGFGAGVRSVYVVTKRMK